MDYIFKLCIFVAVCWTGFCASTQRNSSEEKKTQVRDIRSSIGDFMVCGMTGDTACFLDVADVMVEKGMNDILAQADKEAVKTSGRADEENSPSQLSKTIHRIISELTEIFRDGLSGIFKSAREGEDEDETEESDNTKKEDSQKGKSADLGEARGKKKKKKLIGLIKLIIIGLVLKAKITLLLKALSAALQLKFFLVALAGLILNAARFYLDLKKGHHPQKVIYYEHAQHQHHYDGEEDWGSSSGPGGYWGRSYDEEERPSAHDLAYAKQKPYRHVDHDKSNGFSWFG